MFGWLGITDNMFSFLSNSVPKSHIDDEYANATERDPKILLTTSRNPSAPLTQFVKVGVVLWCFLLINTYADCGYAFFF